MQAKHEGEMKKPELQDFGITTWEYALYSRKGGADEGVLDFSHVLATIICIIFVPVAVLVVFFANIDWEFLGLLILPPVWFLLYGVAFGIALAIVRLIAAFKRQRLLKGPVISRIKLYEEATAAYRVKQQRAWDAQRDAERQRREAEKARKSALRSQQRKREQYWKSLGGIEFEQELGKLYRARGYRVEWTPTSGDQGIDIILKRNGKTAIVQCKAQKRPASPAVVRELFGSMVAFGADNAILACTGGFTDGVRKFARDKPIELISASHIARMAEASVDKTQAMVESPPVCPKHGCGRAMVLRNGRRGRFWGCPGYPTCRGTRNL